MTDQPSKRHEWTENDITYSVSENEVTASMADNVAYALISAPTVTLSVLCRELLRLASRVEELESDNRELRRTWCFLYASTAAYMDDGEASDAREHPHIDFLRDSLAEIRDKIRERFRRRVESDHDFAERAKEATDTSTFLLRRELEKRVEELEADEKMRCVHCGYIAPENEKDWPNSECVVCTYADRHEEQGRRIKELERENERLGTKLVEVVADFEHDESFAAMKQRAETAERALAEAEEDILAVDLFLDWPPDHQVGAKSNWRARSSVRRALDRAKEGKK